MSLIARKRHKFPTQNSFFMIAVMCLSFLSANADTAEAHKASFGRYTTNFGPLILYAGDRDKIAGFYYYNKLPAHLFLSREGKGRYKGIWVQGKSERRCKTKKNGSAFWGNIEAGFKNGRFLALWNYCNDPLVNRENRQWQGTRKK